MTVNGAISALRSACLMTTLAEAEPLQARRADILLRHHLDHRGPRHARDVADAVDRHRHHRQREIVEGDALPVADAAEPFSQPSHDAKMTVKMTPETYSGVAVVAIEATDSVRSVRDPSRMPARMPIEQRDRHHRHHHPEHQDAGGAAAPGTASAATLRLELGRAAEIALQDARKGRHRRLVAEREARRRPARSRDRCSAASARRRATGRSGRRSSGGSRC